MLSEWFYRNWPAVSRAKHNEVVLELARLQHKHTELLWDTAPQRHVDDNGTETRVAVDGSVFQRGYNGYGQLGTGK